MTLADSIEQASGPDRALDKAIFVTLFPDQVPELGRPNDYGWREEASYWWLQTGEDQRSPRQTIIPPCYTASLDAVATLMPEGMWIECVRQNNALTRWYAQIERPDCVSYLATASTEVLARLAAILRAHEQGGEGDD